MNPHNYSESSSTIIHQGQVAWWKILGKIWFIPNEKSVMYEDLCNNSWADVRFDMDLRMMSLKYSNLFGLGENDNRVSEG